MSKGGDEMRDVGVAPLTLKTRRAVYGKKGMKGREGVVVPCRRSSIQVGI